MFSLGDAQTITYDVHLLHMFRLNLIEGLDIISSLQEVKNLKEQG